MKRIMYVLTALTIVACSGKTDLQQSNSHKSVNPQSEPQYEHSQPVAELVFGHAYGLCKGESCVETFKLTSSALFEDVVDDYNHKRFEFKQLDNASFLKAKGLLSNVPNELWQTATGRVGCPDCADGGGVFIQYRLNGNTKSWFIDNNLNHIPKSLHPFIKEVRKTVASINNEPLPTGEIFLQ